MLIRWLVLSMLLSFLIFAPSSLAAQNSGEAALRNQDITALVKAGLTSEVIIAKIKTSACDFDTSPAALESLKAADVPDAVILAMVQAPHSSGNSESTDSSQPTVDQILRRFTQAIGGESENQKRTSSHAEAVEEINGKTASMELFEKSPDKTVTIVKFPKAEEIRDGFDGSVAWNSSPGGVREKTGEELSMVRWLAEFGWGIVKKDAILTLKDEQMVNGRPAYVIEADLGDGALSRMYFDKETYLMVRRDVELDESQGRVSYSWYFDDYRTVDGRKIAFLRRMPSANLTIRFTSVEDNVPVNDGLFTEPSGKRVFGGGNMVKSVAYRVIPQQSMTYYQSGTNSSYTSCYGSGQFSTFGNYGNLNMNTNCNTIYTTPTQIPITWRYADVYVVVENVSQVYLIGCRANWRWSNCEPLIVGDVFPAEISGNTMTISALKKGKKTVHTKYTILQVRQK